jgi:hypothetical protein
MDHIKIFKDYSNEKFKEWFGESKIIDEKTGKPLVMYHGSPHIDNIKEFETKKGYFFFTSEPMEAARYTGKNGWDEEQKFIRTFYVKCQNPFNATKMNDTEKDGIYPILKSEGVKILTESYDGCNLREDVWDFFEGRSEESKDIEWVINDPDMNFEFCKHMFENHCDNYVILELPIVQDWIKSNGYDGFYTLESGWGLNLAVYGKNQVKSATDNNGNFSLRSGNIFENSSN